MGQNKMINHIELADLGYYFLNQNQEEYFLQIINDEYALRVGEEILRRIPREKQTWLFTLPEGEMQDYLKRNVPGIEEVVISMRRDLLGELREVRRVILLNKDIC